MIAQLMRPQSFWQARRDSILRLIGFGGSIASFVGLLFVFQPPQGGLPWWAKAMLAIGTASGLAVTWFELKSWRGRAVFLKDDRNGIKRYMLDWISHGGRVAIWTRDMTWAQHDEDAKSALLEKARKKELVICLPKRIREIEELEAAGAEIRAYGNQRFADPASRFTITSFNRAGARVAVAKADGEFHVIDEFVSGEHVAFYLAQDLISLAGAHCERRSAK